MAFYSVNHRMLCDTMHVNGVLRAIIDRTYSFLSNRIFKVRVAVSQPAPVPPCSGVPPDTVLDIIILLIFTYILLGVLSGNVPVVVGDIKFMSDRSQYDELHQSFLATVQCSNDCDQPLNAAKCSQILILANNICHGRLDIP